MEEMGMTDKQFNGFLRFLMQNLKDAQKEPDESKLREKVNEIIENLQETLED